MEDSTAGAGPRLTPAKRQIGELPEPGPEASLQDGGKDGSVEVKRFLSGIGLGRYLAKLLARGFDCMEALEAMEEEDMRQEVGMLPGHVRLLQKHLASRRGAAPRGKQGGPAAEPAAAPAAAQVATPALLPALEMPIASAEDTTRPCPLPAVPTGQAAEVEHQALFPKSAPPQRPELASEFAEQALVEFRDPGPAPVGEAMPAGLPGGPAPQNAQSNLQKAEAQYFAALQAAQATTATDPEPAGPDDTLQALAQLAEESAQLVATAASFCAWPQADSRQLSAVVDAAQQAAQRAQWSAVAAMSCGDPPDHDKEWSGKMRRAAVQAAEVAEQYARDCAKAATSTGRPQAVARAFCKFHVESRCMKGSMCEFSHDIGVLPVLPLANKVELPCVFFAKGQCNRGCACPFSHGEEELNEVLRLKQGPPVVS
uniref:C3H1-type domain-containing protein n=1 Tax=Alexandrium monilatum TaxID=311494 RepID=A0A7S4PZV8_9DINO